MLQYIFAVRRGVRGPSPCIHNVPRWTAAVLWFCLHLKFSPPPFHDRFSLSREKGEENHARHCSSPGPERRSVFPRGPDADADAQRLSTPHPSPINHRRRKEKNAGGKGGEGDPIPWLWAPRGASSVIRQVMRPSPSPGDRKRAWLERP